MDYDKGGMDNWTNIAEELISKNLAAPCKVCKLQASITDYLLLDVPAVLPLVGAQLSLSQPGGQIMPTTLLAPLPKSLNRERRRSATPFYPKERCGSGPPISEERNNMSGPLFPLFFSGFLFFLRDFFSL